MVTTILSTSPTSIRMALVWMRMPHLLVELWGSATLQSIAGLARELVAVDQCTIEWSRIGFASICIRLNPSQSLHPGVLIGGLGRNQGQRFVYENRVGICFSYSLFHGSGEAC